MTWWFLSTPSTPAHADWRLVGKCALFNEQGAVELPLLVSDRIRPGTLYLPKGAWMRNSATGLTANGLIPGHKADLAGGACYYDCTVDIQPIPTKEPTP